MRLKDKVAIVTGATSGIGRATAFLFAEEGAKVAAVGRRAEEGEKTVRQIKEKKGEAIFIKADVSRAQDVREMISSVLKAYGRIDILFNNAGVNPDPAKKPLADLSEGMWDQVMDINVKGVFLTSKYVIPEMIKNGGGTIVNTSSNVGYIAMKNRSVYVASKGAVTQLTKSMALDYAPFNIRVNSVCPALIETEMATYFLEAARKDPKTLECLLCRHPIGRFGKPEEVARTVLFLASDESSFITGSSVMVDGGYTAQ